MKYILNPAQIFFPWVIKDNRTVTHFHTLKKNKLSYFPLENQSYYDHIETASFYNSTIISYGHDEKKNLKLGFHHVFPMVRKVMNDTRGSFAFQTEDTFCLYINQKKVEEKLSQVDIYGWIDIYSTFENYVIKRKMYAATSFAGFICEFCIYSKNFEEIIEVEVAEDEQILIDKKQTAKRKEYYFRAQIFQENQYLPKLVQCGNEIRFTYVISLLEKEEKIHFDLKKEYQSRKLFLKQMQEKCVLKTDNPYLDYLFYLCKIRASESIFKTKNGFMHSPGGGQYYAALWCNDQIEYAAPFFAYLNYDIALQACENCFSLYEKYMYTPTALVTSIIAEGDSYWNGAKDRGDGAMYAYGTLKYLLTRNDSSLNKKYKKAITWCLDYTKAKKNKNGMYDSDADELENRFESGSCNIATNSIFYAALLDYTKLYKENTYSQEIKEFPQNFDHYFYCNNIEGFSTYRYCQEETHLRSHIFYPLIAKLFNKKDEVISSLIHSPVFVDGNFLTTTACDTYWDRVTLMALRGLYNAEYPTYSLLLQYTKNRLLGDHVPYPFEAYPEGNKAHLSAESALYCRCIIEGMLNYEVIDENHVSFCLNFAESQKKLSLKNFYTNGIILHLQVKKRGQRYKVRIFQKKKVTTFLVKNLERFVYSIPNKNES